MRRMQVWNSALGILRRNIHAYVVSMLIPAFGRTERFKPCF